MFINFNTKKYHVFAPMGRFQLESIYLYFPLSSQLVYTTVKNKGNLILSLGKPKRMWEENVRVDLKGIGVYMRNWLIRLRIGIAEKPL